MVNTTEGSSVTFLCEILSEPGYEIAWYFDQTVVTSSDRHSLSSSGTIEMLTISSVTILDAGYYTCSASNVHGTANATEELRVQGKSLFASWLEPKNFQLLKMQLGRSRVLPRI